MEERVNGYIKLDNILGLKDCDNKSITTILDELKTFKNIEINDNNKIISFIYNGEKYYWKNCYYQINTYNELIVCEIADCLSIPHIEYDLASIGTFNGVISKNYKTDGCKYINGRELLTESLEEDWNYTLDDIWLALEKRYASLPNMQEVVSKLMKKIIDMFILDILVMQSDRHSKNWEIVESDSGEIDLQPLYDNEYLFVKDHPLLEIDYSRFDDNDEFINLIRNFQEISSNEFSNILKNSLWVIEESNLNQIFTKIENKIKSPIPNNVKQYYLKKFNTQSERIKKALSKNVKER